MKRVCWSLLCIAWIGSSPLGMSADEARSAAEKPNVVIIFTDDQGYADVGCFGAKGFETPHLDRMAREGTRFTSFYVSSPVCSASRAALLTGCYHLRAGVRGVFFPTRAGKGGGTEPGPGKDGLHPDEITVAELLKGQGYATGCIGKWHLGDALPFLPTRQGFDTYYGIPYSNDMGWWQGLPKGARSEFPPLPVLENEIVVETNPDQRTLTRRYTERAVSFIKEHRDEPFFLYLPHTMPHVPLFVSEDFAGRTERGLYGDVIEEIDWSVGQVLSILGELDLERRTLVIFTTDNGPWLSKKEHGGSAKPLRDGKFTHYEGGQRTPCIMRWPGHIPAGRVCDEVLATIDILPTVAGLAGAKVPMDRTIDGVDAWPLISGTASASPRRVFFYGTQAVREGPWKLFKAGKCRETVPLPGGQTRYEHPRLYNLDEDLAESRDVHEQHPEITKRLLDMLEVHARDLEKNARPVGHVDKL